jgi:hypothetical protein
MSVDGLLPLAFQHQQSQQITHTKNHQPGAALETSLSNFLVRCGRLEECSWRT